ncbi:hypothetical protein GH714_010517 [Hevea brasiliensis]|uniref:PORR domain-containing protein n=1 Tax=Hevea brasiliensis TaxID=3981 RepID=A0A6A6KQ27_HEVBR|nr:hypothetical protein GH714_010517 [Hevea brasiliensis]
MIHRYPSIFELFTIPTPHLPLNATKPYSQLCVRLTSAAAALADQEFKLHSAISNNLAAKLQTLLMLSSHRRLLLSKLVHLAPDLGLPPNFRSRLCNDHPDKFKTVDTSYGRALELVSWDVQLAVLYPALMFPWFDRWAFEEDETSALKDQLMELVRESKKMRREMRNGTMMNSSDIRDSDASRKKENFGWQILTLVVPMRKDDLGNLGSKRKHYTSHALFSSPVALIKVGPSCTRSWPPPNFRSRLCNDHPDKFKTVDTSYGRALELVSWDVQLAVPLSRPDVSLGLIVDRPLKFKHLRLRKGLNLKRRHQDFLIKFEELPDVCPYNTSSEEFVKESIEAEKRACAVIREVLGMTVEKRTLIDHLTHFRKEFGFPNKLRGLIVRHPEFYVSLKGLRDSVFLTEGYDDKGGLLKKDETSALKDQLMELVRESKKMRREMRNGTMMNSSDIRDSDDASSDEFDDIGDYYNDGLRMCLPLKIQVLIMI